MKICYDQPGCNDIGVVIATKDTITYFTYYPPTNIVHGNFLHHGFLDVREV